MADKPDWFKLYPSRFLQDSIVDQMTTEELGCCVRLMCRQWLDGSIPDDLDRLARICRLDRSGMGQAWVTLCQFFPPLQEGHRANRFMFIERELVSRKMEDKSRKGLEAATKRWYEVRKNKDGSPMPNPLGNPMQDTDTDIEKNKNKEMPSAPIAPLRVKKVKEKKVRITALKPDSVEAFNEAWACIPPTRRVIDKIINDWVNEPIPKGSRFKAEENFQAIVDSGHATPYELYAAIHAYVNEDANVKKGFYQHISTFYGPEKATWIQWMERAKQLVAEAQ